MTTRQELEKAYDMIKDCIMDHDLDLVEKLDLIFDEIELYKYDLAECNDCGWIGQAGELVDEGNEEYCCPNCFSHNYRMEGE